MSARARAARSPPRCSCSASSTAASNGRISTSPAWSGQRKPATSTTRARPASAWLCSTGSSPTISRSDRGFTVAAMIVDFYHLGASPLERVLPSICEKVLASAGRLLVVAEAEMLPRLDEQLWTYAKDSFLPHGTARPESQPILLSAEPAPANGAANVALADGRWR